MATNYFGNLNTGIIGSLTSKLSKLGVNNLAANQKNAMSPFPAGGMSKNPIFPTPSGKPITSSVGATSTTPVTITPPKKNPVINSPEAKKFVSNQMTNTNPQVQGSNTMTPPIPTDNTPTYTPPASTAKTDYLNAYKAYMEAQNNTGDITKAKTAYNDYVANQSKSVAGLEGQGRGIPLSLVRGEQEKLLRQTQPEAQRLQGDIGIAQDAQKATVDSLKSGVDLYGKLLEQDKPVEVGGILYRPQADGSYTPITPGKANEGFTLGKDQVRYDANGNVVAGGGQGTASNGYVPGTDPTADAWVKYVQNGGKITDVPNEYQNAVAQGTTSQGKPQSEISKNVISVIDELLVNPALDRISGSIDKLIGGNFGNAALAKNKYNQLKSLLSLDNIKYLKGTGSISDAEQRLLANAASAIGRNLSDEDFKNELIKLKNGLNAAKDNQIAPDEEQFLKSQGYSQEEINSLKTSFNNVGGDTNKATGNFAQKNNNPLNIKSSSFTQKFEGVSGVNPKPAQDGGKFLTFETPQAGFDAAKRLITSSIYANLDVNSALKKWSGKGYGGEIVPTLKNKTIASLTPTELDTLIKTMAKREGFYA